MNIQRAPKPALAEMYRQRAQRMSYLGGSRGYWDSRGVLINDPEKCAKRRQDLLDIAATYDDPKLYEQFVED